MERRSLQLSPPFHLQERNRSAPCTAPASMGGSGSGCRAGVEPPVHMKVGFVTAKGWSKRWKELAIEVGRGSRRKFPESLKTNKTSHQGWGFMSPGRAIPWLQHHSHIPAPCPPTDASGCCDAWLSLPLWEAGMEP